MNDQLKDRKKEDRRQRDLGTPTGWKERRRNADRRLAQVSEATFEEWVTWMVRQRSRMQADSKTAKPDDPNHPLYNQRSGVERREEDTGSPTGWRDRRYGERRHADQHKTSKTISFQALPDERKRHDGV